MPDTVCVTFRFAVNQVVRWTRHPRHHWTVVWRRAYEDQAIRSVHYGLHRIGDAHAQIWIVEEPDLAPVYEETP